MRSRGRRGTPSRAAPRLLPPVRRRHLRAIVRGGRRCRGGGGVCDARRTARAPRRAAGPLAAGVARRRAGGEAVSPVTVRVGVAAVRTREGAALPRVAPADPLAATRVAAIAAAAFAAAAFVAAPAAAAFAVPSHMELVECLLYRARHDELLDVHAGGGAHARGPRYHLLVGGGVDPPCECDACIQNAPCNTPQRTVHRTV